MAIKTQDIVVLSKLIASDKQHKDWTQNSMANELCLSPSQVNSALKRLVSAGLITPYNPPDKPRVIYQACEEFFVYGLKYVFPATPGKISRGIPTSYAAPSFKDEISLGSEAIPVWPFGEGTERGASIEPLYSSVPKSISSYPDQLFYDILSLLDAIRSGRARERQIAIDKLSEILNSQQQRHQSL